MNVVFTGFPPSRVHCMLQVSVLCHSDVILSCDVMVTCKLSENFIARPGFIWEKL